MDNCTSVVKNLLDQLQVNYTNKFLENSILSNSEHPSLLSVSDTLSKYNIINFAVRVDEMKLNEFPLPCIVQLSDYGGMFYVLTKYSNDELEYLDNKGRKLSIPKPNLLTKWNRVCLLIEGSIQTGEPGIKKKLLEKRIFLIFKWIGIFGMILWNTFSFFDTSNSYETNLLWLVSYLFIKLVILAIVVLFLLY